MQIALLGYGKMGKAIEEIAIERGHKILTTIDNEEEWNNRKELLKQCDVAIDFSMPSTAVENIRKCFAISCPIVVGTTGWYDQLESLIGECKQKKQALFVASNFSIGMNIMFDLNQRLAKLMNRHPEYEVDIVETHHIHKLDAPSGTAISLANDIVTELERKDKWALSSELWVNENEELDMTKSKLDLMPNGPQKNEVVIGSVRQGEIPGTHTVTYESDIDVIAISHAAKSRKGLALGAVLAAEFLDGKTGYFTMKDLLA